MKKFLIAASICAFALVSAGTVEAKKFTPKKKGKTVASFILSTKPKPKPGPLAAPAVKQPKTKSARFGSNAPVKSKVLEGMQVKFDDLQLLLNSQQETIDKLKEIADKQQATINGLKETKKSKLEERLEKLEQKKEDGNVTAENFSKYDSWKTRYFFRILNFLSFIFLLVLIWANGRRDKVRNKIVDTLFDDYKKRLNL